MKQESQPADPEALGSGAPAPGAPRAGTPRSGAQLPRPPSSGSDSSGRTALLSLSPEELQTRVCELGGKAFHARIILRELFENGVLAYGEMTGLSKALRGRLEEELPLLSSTEKARSVSSDGTTKLLLELHDGRTVETVHMPSTQPGKGATLCVSTQVGCPVGCPFCASGLLGLERNLESHEILEQYLWGRTLGPLSRSVVMGIGEPFLNFEALSVALHRVNQEIGLGTRKITVSSVGFPERLRRAAPTKPPFQLAISLHSAFDRERWELVPAMDGVPVQEILAAGDNWFEVTGREVTYEIVLLAGKNDSPRHAQALAALLSQRRATVNLIPWNPIRGSESGGVYDGAWKRPGGPDAERFREVLVEAGVVATVRWSRGLGSDAACGQLRSRS